MIGGRAMKLGAIMRMILAVTGAAMLGACAVTPDDGMAVSRDRVEERSIAELSRALAAGETSSEALVLAYIDRIEGVDRAGPRLNSVIAINPDALAQAREADSEGHDDRRPLHGVPILVKDNIETSDPMATTAGSLALRDNVTGRDAPVVARLRAAGAIILGKTNLSEWANIRSSKSMSGWSAVGGQVRNPYALDRSPCGSSSGSGAAVAASLAAGALGTETDGSVVCPAAINGLVGFKPSVGLVSRTHIVPISHSQDTAGPMARTVEDAALLLDAMAGLDPADKATINIANRPSGFAAGLNAQALSGMRVGVIRDDDNDPALLARFDAALTALKAAGAVLVAVDKPKLEGIGEAEFAVLLTELKADLNAYLATTPPAVTTRTLDDVIAFNMANAAQEMPFFGQDIFEQAARTKGLSDPAYKAARAKSLRLAGREGIDAMLKKHKVALLVTPTYGQAWLIDPVYGDNFQGPSASDLPAIAGYPHLTVPMGLADGLPVGISFIGPAWSDARVLAAGYAFEQASHMRVPPRYLPSADVGPGLDPVR